MSVSLIKTTELAARIEKVRQDCRIAQLVGEMVTEGWDRADAEEIAEEFAAADRPAWQLSDDVEA